MGSPERVLDPAGGRGEFVNAVPAEERWLVDVVDYPERQTDPRVKIVIGNLFDIELPDAYFDGVFASNLLEHFHSPEEVGEFLDRMRDDAGARWRARADGPELQVLRTRLLRLRRPSARAHARLGAGAAVRRGLQGDRGHSPVPAVLVPQPAARVAAARRVCTCGRRCSGGSRASSSSSSRRRPDPGPSGRRPPPGPGLSALSGGRTRW